MRPPPSKRPFSRRAFLHSGMLLASSALAPELPSLAPRTDSARALTPRTLAFNFPLPGEPFAVTRETGRRNPIRAENEQPGTTAWRPARYQYDLLGFASATSVAAGEALQFFVDTSAARFDLRVYRLGYYGGLGGRLIAEFPNLPGGVQPEPYRDVETGLTSYSTWVVSHTLTIPSEWVSGLYLAKLTRADTGGEGFILFVVRDDERRADILCQHPITTYHAYNNFGGKSLYSHIGEGCDTVSGAPRAVKVSLNRPYNAPLEDHNQFLSVEFHALYWLEAQGYDLAYCTNLDVHAWGQPGARNRLLDQRVFLSIGHDEYWSQAMRSAITAARDAGVPLAFFGANTSYWRIRLEPDPYTGQPDRTIVCYKTTESGPADPSGEPTGTWRDVTGANEPENALLGVQYIGDNDSAYFPLRVAAEFSTDRLYRNTGLQTLPPGTAVEIGQRLMGWEWDAVVENGRTPPNLTVLAASPVVGALLTDDGDSKTRVVRLANAHVTRYTAPSGAQVFATGTLQWSWGLALVEPNGVVQQMTYNALADMGVLPSTPADTLSLDEAASGGTPPPTPQPVSLGSAPAIRNIAIAASDTSATVTWDTDRDAHVQVWLGDSAERVNAVQGPSTERARTGQWTISNLQPGARYFVRVAAWESASALALSDVQSFETQFVASASGARQWASTATEPVLCQVRPAARWMRANQGLAALLGGAVALVAGWGGWRWLRRSSALRRRRPECVKGFWTLVTKV